jgi:hypothetical protein
MKTKLQEIILGLTIFGALFAEANVCVAALENNAQELNASIQTQPSATKLPPVAHLQVLASVGPLEYLSGAEVTVRDALGIVIAKQKTNSRGSTIFHINQQRLAAAVKPLRFTTSGGQVIGQTGNQTSGPAFYGHLRGQISKVPVGKHTIAYLDLISTSASVMRSKTRSYASATKAVRAALSIGKGFPVNGIRFKNNHVGSAQLQAATEAYGGYDQYVRNMVHRINRRQKITELTPVIYATTAAPQKNAASDVLTNAIRPSEAQGLQAQATQATSTSTYPQCNVPLGNGSSTSASTEIIEDFGVTSMSILLKAAGAPSAAASGIAGMLLTGGATGSPSASALQAVDAQLVCISAQLSYLSEQIGEMAYTIDIQSAENCAADATTQYYNYSGLVNDAQDCSSSNCQLNAGNPSLLQDLEAWDPSGSQVGGCSQGATVNNVLFGTSGGQAPGWQQLNENYQGINAWYTALQVQQLQQTLSYWGTVQYDAFVLTNEYYNYYTFNSESGQSSESAQSSAGNVPGSSVCITGTTSTTPNFCAAMSNIGNAYPPDLYSDEIGIWSTVNGGAGLAISAYPAGLALGLGQLGLQPYYLGQNTPDPGSWAASKATGPSVTQFNNQGINPGGLPSAIEQFSNPQAHKTLQPTSAQVASITSNNYSQGSGTGVTSWQYFVNAINQKAPSGYSFPMASEWTNLAANNNTSQNTPNGTGFFTSDNMGEFSHKAEGGPETCNDGTESGTVTTYDFNTTIGSYYWQYTSCGGGATPNNSVNLAPVFGVLLGRNWWPASATNPPTSYTPPPPCVPGSTASACNVPAPTLNNLWISNNNGAASIQLNFTPPSSSSGGMPIMQYLASCTSTNASTPITITGGTTPSTTFITLQGESGSGGYIYSCTIEAMNSLGITSQPSNALSSASSSAPSVPQPPMLNTGTYFPYESSFGSSGASIGLSYTAPADTGGSRISAYNAICTADSYIVTGTTTSSSTISMLGGSGTANAPYYTCTVTATNATGTSQPSNPITIMYYE